jgi:hypothetical protein
MSALKCMAHAHSGEIGQIWSSSVKIGQMVELTNFGAASPFQGFSFLGRRTDFNRNDQSETDLTDFEHVTTCSQT